MSYLLNRTENQILSDASRQDHAAVSHDLSYLQRHESRAAYRADLAQINQDVNRLGILPNTEISQRYYHPVYHHAAYQQHPYHTVQHLGHRPYVSQAAQHHPPYYGSGGYQQRYRGSNPGDVGGGVTYDGANVCSPELMMQNARVVVQVARELGVDPVTAVATMLVESGGNNLAEGDRHHSIGLFQLNKYGEGRGLTKEQCQDPWTNARVALTEFRQHRSNDPGTLAASAQRPSNRVTFARRVDRNLAAARQIVEQA